MVEGASIDKQEHWIDGDRAIWEAIEFDRAVAVALDFARRTNSDANPANDTLVIVTADHETGGLALIGVGNERYAPKVLGSAVRDYAAVFRFEPDQATLDFFPNYQRDARGYPADPDPTRKLLLGWAAAPDHYENWLANRRPVQPAVNAATSEVDGRLVVVPRPVTANAARDGNQDQNVNGGRRIRGFLVTGSFENGATGCPSTTVPARHRHRGRGPVHRRPHGLGRPAVGQRPRRADLHRNLRQHGRVRRRSSGWWEADKVSDFSLRQHGVSRSLDCLPSCTSIVGVSSRLLMAEPVRPELARSSTHVFATAGSAWCPFSAPTTVGARPPRADPLAPPEPCSADTPAVASSPAPGHRARPAAALGTRHRAPGTAGADPHLRDSQRRPVHART